MFVVFIFLTSTSCNAEKEQKNEIKATEYKNWVEDNKSEVKRTTTFKKANLEFSMRYLPNGIQGGDELKGSTFLYEIKGLKGGNPMLYNLENKTQAQRINYLTSQIEKDIILIDENGDSLLAEHSIFERTYGIVPFIRILFYFGKECEIEPENITILMNESVYGYGIMKYHFDKNFFTKLPKVVQYDK